MDRAYSAAVRSGSAATFGAMVPPSCSILHPGTAAWNASSPFAVTFVRRRSRSVSPLQSLRWASPASVTPVPFRPRRASALYSLR